MKPRDMISKSSMVMTHLFMVLNNMAMECGQDGFITAILVKLLRKLNTMDFRGSLSIETLEMLLILEIEL